MDENNTEIKTEVTKVEVETSSDSITKKDLLIPVSIVVAGLFVGAGLYFSGGAPAGSAQLTNQQNGGVQEAEPIDVAELAESVGVDKDDFAECLQDESIIALVDEQTQNAVDTGGRGTPWNILIGPGGKMYPVNGALPLENMDQIIAAARAEADQGLEDTDESLTLDKMIPVSAEDNIRGSLDADFIIIEYSDFDCPYCKRFHTTMKTVMEKYDGEVAWVYRHFPLLQLHPNAKNVAVASECVAKLGGNDAFWEFADAYAAN